MDKVDKLILAAYNASFFVQGTTNVTIRKTLISLASKLEENTERLVRANKKDVASQDPADPPC